MKDVEKVKEEWIITWNGNNIDRKKINKSE